MLQADDIGATVGRVVVDTYPDGTAPGTAVLLARKGEILYRGGTGRANLEHQVPLRPDMPFRLGSLTKPITATTILMLVESGRLALTDTLERLVPEYPTGDATITLEHLLTHTSGIPEFTELPEWYAIHRQDVTIDQVVDLFTTVPLAFAPGTRWAYSNSGHLLLGAIIEKVSGESYADHLARQIFAPLEMASTSYDPTSGRIIPHMVSGYSRGADAYVHPEYFSFTHFHAAGGLTSTVDDLARWWTALSSGTLLGAQTLGRMWTPATLADDRSARYGYGWWVGECRGHRAVEHYGSLPGYATYLLALPEDGILVVVLSNDQAAVNRVERLAVEIAGTALGDPYRPPAPVPLSAPELGRFAGSYRSRDGSVLTLTVDGGRLTLRTSAGDRFVLRPDSSREFFFPEVPESRLVFRGADDRVDGLEWQPRRGMPVQARKTS